MSPSPKVAEVTWENLIPPEQWRVYACVLTHMCSKGIPFALGGGLALGYYTDHLRRSKDLDIYVRPEDRHEVIDVVNRCGMNDYYDVSSYDRGWIYRAHLDGVIVDTIWAMANKRTQVDDVWLDGPQVQLCGQTLPVIPPEELIWSKLYVLQRDRCDWPDIINLIGATGPELDWEHLLSRVAEDLPLLKGVMSIFSWLAPQQALRIPKRVWSTLELPLPVIQSDPAGRPSRKDLLDTRPWLLAESA